MKLLFSVLAGVSLFAATNASALNCVGGPRFAFYAYTNVQDAFICARNVARVSRACAAAVRSGNCIVQNNAFVDATSPQECTCPGQFAIGTWPNNLNEGAVDEADGNADSN